MNIKEDCTEFMDVHMTEIFKFGSFPHWYRFGGNGAPWLILN